MEDEALSKTTVGGAFFTIGKSIANLLPYSLLFFIIAKTFPTVQDLGLIQSLISITIISVIIASLGLPLGAVRLIPFYQGRGEKEIAQRISLFIFLTGILFSVFVAIMLFYLSAPISNTMLHDRDLAYLINLIAIDVFLSSVVNFSNYLLYSYYEFKYAAKISIINSLLRFIIPLLFISMAGPEVELIVIGYIIADAASCILFSVGLAPKLGKHMRLSISYIKSVFGYSFPLYGANLLRYVSISIDYYLLLFLSNLYVAGIYTPAILLANALSIILIAAGDTMVPYSSRVYGISGPESLKRILHFVSRYVFLLFIPLGFIVVVNTEALIMLFFGSKYSESISPAIIIASVITLTSVGPIFDSVLSAAGMSRTVLASFSLALPSQILVSAVTIPIFGALGASLSRSIALIIKMIYSASRLKKRNILHFDRGAFVVGVTGSLIMVSVIFVLNQFVLGTHFALINSLVGIFVYLVFLRYKKAVNEQDTVVLMKFSPSPTRRALLLIMKIIRK
jgi:teichuronic acid exporter